MTGAVYGPGWEKSCRRALCSSRATLSRTSTKCLDKNTFFSIFFNLGINELSIYLRTMLVWHASMARAKYWEEGWYLFRCIFSIIWRTVCQCSQSYFECQCTQLIFLCLYWVKFPMKLAPLTKIFHASSSCIFWRAKCTDAIKWPRPPLPQLQHAADTACWSSNEFSRV